MAASLRSRLRVFYADGEETGANPGDKGTGDKDAGDKGAGDKALFTEQHAERWREMLPEELREHKGLAKIANPEGLARAYISAASMIGADTVRVPAPDDEAGFLAAMDRLGRPADAKAYKLTAPEGSPDWLKPEDEYVQQFVTVAHKNGLTQRQMQAMYGAYAASVAEGTRLQEKIENERAEANLAALRKDWGDEFDLNVGRANVAAEKLDEGLMDVLNEAGVGTNPVVMGVLARLGKMFQEDTGNVLFRGTMVGDDGRTAAQLTSEANSLTEQATDDKLTSRQRRELSERALDLRERAAKLRGKK